MLITTIRFIIITGVTLLSLHLIGPIDSTLILCFLALGFVFAWKYFLVRLGCMIAILGSLDDPIVYERTMSSEVAGSSEEKINAVTKVMERIAELDNWSWKLLKLSVPHETNLIEERMKNETR